MRKPGFCWAAAILLGVGISSAATIPMRLQPVTHATGYDQALSVASRMAQRKLHLPALIPEGELFAYYDATTMVPGLTLISFDRTKDCHGVHACTLGSFQVSRQPVEMLKDMQGQLITRRLADGSFFTPEHVMADTFPAQLQWREQGQTYTITWAGLQEGMVPAILERMKRSASARHPR